MKDITKFLFEIGHMKRLPRTGWFVAGVAAPESLAEHSFRTIWIGYYLALKAGANPGRVVMMCLAHDVQEARIGDHHKISQSYLDVKAVEPKVFRDQVNKLPKSDEMIELHGECMAGETLEAQIARDADRLECAFQALEYVNEGHEPCRPFFENTRQNLKTESAIALWDALAETDPKEWYLSLPRVP